MSNIIQLTFDDFDQVVKDSAFLLIDFWAEWCPPCKAFGKVIEMIAPDYPHVCFAKVDVDEQEQLAAEFEVRSVPRVLILRDQTVVYDDAGALGADALRALLDQAKDVEL